MHVNISLNTTGYNVNDLDFIILFMLFDEQQMKIDTRGGDVNTVFHYQKDVKNSVIEKMQKYINNNINELIIIDNNDLSNEIKKVDNFKGMVTQLIDIVENNKMSMDKIKDITKKLMSKISYDTKGQVKKDVYDDIFESNENIIDFLNSANKDLNGLKDDTNDKIKQKKMENQKIIVKKLLTLFNNKIKEQIDITDTTGGGKLQSFILKKDRIEFRIMGGNYLHENVQKYILELQQIFLQQYLQPKEIKKYCYIKQLKSMMKENPNFQWKLDKSKHKSGNKIEDRSFNIINEITDLNLKMEKIEYLIADHDSRENKDINKKWILMNLKELIEKYNILIKQLFHRDDWLNKKESFYYSMIMEKIRDDVINREGLFVVQREYMDKIKKMCKLFKLIPKDYLLFKDQLIKYMKEEENNKDVNKILQA